MSVMIAERELDYFGDAQPSQGAVRVFAPEQNQDDWRCDYEIEWRSFQRSFRAHGVDSWQALVLALKVIPVEISTTDDFKAGRIGCFGTITRSEADLSDALGLKGF